MKIGEKESSICPVCNKPAELLKETSRDRTIYAYAPLFLLLLLSLFTSIIR